jgi:hypothetical protein
MYFKAKNIFKNNKQIQGFWYILFLKNIICEKAPSRHFFFIIIINVTSFLFSTREKIVVRWKRNLGDLTKRDLVLLSLTLIQ